MPRIKPRAAPRIDVEIPKGFFPDASRLYVDVDVAQLVRKCAGAEKKTISGFVEHLVRYWLRKERPEWQFVEREPEGTRNTEERASAELPKTKT